MPTPTEKIMKTLSVFPLLASMILAACSADTRKQSMEAASVRGTWSMKAPMPIQIGEVTVAATGSKIYVIGGSTADVVDQKLNQEYDIAANTWRNRAPLPRGIHMLRRPL
jgi:Kelch motif